MKEKVASQNSNKITEYEMEVMCTFEINLYYIFFIKDNDVETWWTFFYNSKFTLTSKKAGNKQHRYKEG